MGKGVTRKFQRSIFLVPETERRNASDGSDDEDEDEKPPAPTAAEKAAESSGPPKSSYVPPHLRNASQTAASGPSMAPSRLVGGPRGRGRAAPDINSDINFPSLSAGGAPEEPGKG